MQAQEKTYFEKMKTAGYLHYDILAHVQMLT